jgi:hypothetical protein
MGTHCCFSRVVASPGPCQVFTAFSLDLPPACRTSGSARKVRFSEPSVIHFKLLHYRCVVALFVVIPVLAVILSAAKDPEGLHAPPPSGHFQPSPNQSQKSYPLTQ